MNIPAILGRLIVASFALFIACIAAMAVVALGIWQAIDPGTGDPAIDPLASAFNIVLVASFTILVIGRLVLAPAALAIVISEAFAIRSWIYFAASGALAAVLPLFVSTDSAPQDGFVLGLYLAAGLVGGLIYWLLAGRNSGNWFNSAPPEA